jgi:hypothetical protein
MTLIENIKLINGGGIFQAYAEDAILLNGRVIKNEQDVGLSEHQYNYFYTRHDDRPIRIQNAERPMSSNTPYEIASPKVLVLQFKEYDLNGIMYAVLNTFNGNYNRLRYEVNQVEIRKEIILKSEIGEVRPMDGYRLIKISYTEFLPLDNCEEITCNGDVVIPLTNDVKVYINDVLRYEPSCNTNLELTLVDDLGNPIDATYNGTEIVVDVSCADARVSNSDDSYDVNVASGGDLELPDSQINVNGSNEGNVVSVKTIDVNITDGTSTVVPDAVSLSGNTLDIEVPGAPIGAKLIKTGQTTSYRTGDDGDLEEGRATDFLTLASNNPFGNTNRFTDELGGSTYANDIVIDWSTYNGTDVLGYYRIPLPSNTWANQIDACLALSISTFTSGWRMANFKEFDNIHSKDDTLFSGRFDALNYTPFNISLGNYLSTSTSRDASFSIGYLLNPFGNFGINLISKSSSYQCIAVRTFTVIGTTLT